MKIFPTKDPDEIIDYSADWTDRLEGDTITGAVWEVSPVGLDLQSTVEAGNLCTVWAAGGAAGTTYTLTNRVTTAAGRTWEANFALQVREGGA